MNDSSSTGEARVVDIEKGREARVGHAGKAEGKGREGKGREGSLALSPGARTYACEGPPASEIQIRFRKLFLERFGAEPYLGGGEAVRTFADRLRGTAREKNLEPLELLGQAFARWAAKPLDEIAQNAPYASFAAKLGSLCEPKGANGLSDLDRLQSDQADALKSGDRERYRSLVAEEKRRRGGKP